MLTATIIMWFLSIVWGMLSAAMSGFMGEKAKRRLKYLCVDTKSSESLIRVLERYKNGEFTVQKSNYNDNLLFTKVENNSSGVEYDSQKIYVQVQDPLHKCFGWLADEPHHSWHYDQNFGMICKNRRAISYEAWKMLMELRSTLNEDSEKPVRHGFFKRKHKNEEVQLS